MDVIHLNSIFHALGFPRFSLPQSLDRLQFVKKSISLIPVIPLLFCALIYFYFGLLMEEKPCCI